MVQEITDKAWLAEARTEETKRFIQDIKRFTRRSSSVGNSRLTIGAILGIGHGRSKISAEARAFVASWLEQRPLRLDQTEITVCA